MGQDCAGCDGQIFEDSSNEVNTNAARNIEVDSASNHSPNRSIDKRASIMELPSAAKRRI